MRRLTRALLSLRGRLRRRPFWLGFFVVFVGGAFAGNGQNNASTVVAVLTLYVALCVYGKRLHDFDKPATFMAVPILATLGYYVYAGIQIKNAVHAGMQSMQNMQGMGGSQGLQSMQPMQAVSDVGRSLQGPYFALLALWTIVTLWVGTHPSDKGDNRYGMDSSEAERVPTAPPRSSR